MVAVDLKPVVPPLLGISLTSGWSPPTGTTTSMPPIVMAYCEALTMVTDATVVCQVKVGQGTLGSPAGPGYSAGSLRMALSAVIRMSATPLDPTWTTEMTPPGASGTGCPTTGVTGVPAGPISWTPLAASTVPSAPITSSGAPDRPARIVTSASQTMEPSRTAASST